MIIKAIEMLIETANGSTEEFTKVRQQVTDSFARDYVVTPSTLERLLKAQKAVQHWAKVRNIVTHRATIEEQVAGLETWISDATEQLLECGRSRSTSLVVTAEYEAEEDQLRLVLRQVKQFVSRARG